MKELMAFMPDEAAKLAGISEQTLRRWRSWGLVGHGSSYLKWRDLVGLRVAVALRKQYHISWIRVARVASYLSLYREQPLSALRIWVGPKRRLYFRNPETGQIEDAEGSGQQHIEGEEFGLEAVEAQLWGDVQRSRSRTKDMHGKATRKRGVQGGQACFAGTRIRVATIQQWLREEVPRSEILRNYPTLTAEDLAAAEDGNLPMVG